MKKESYEKAQELEKRIFEKKRNIGAYKCFLGYPTIPLDYFYISTYEGEKVCPVESELVENFKKCVSDRIEKLEKELQDLEEQFKNL